MASRVSSKGQITIPQRIRDRLGVRAGDRVDFVEKGGEIVIRPERSNENPFEAYVGALPHFKNRDEINAWIRDLRGDDTEER